MESFKKISIVILLVIPLCGKAQYDSTRRIEIQTFEYAAQTQLGKVVFYTGVIGAAVSSLLIHHKKDVPTAYPYIFSGVAACGIVIELSAIRKLRKKHYSKINSK